MSGYCKTCGNHPCVCRWSVTDKGKSPSSLAAATGSAYHCELCDTKHPKDAGCHDERPVYVPGERLKCPHCGSGLLWSEERGAHCDGCDDFKAELDLPTPEASHDALSRL